MFLDTAPRKKLAFTKMIPFIKSSPPKTRGPSPPSEAPRAESPTLPAEMKSTSRNRVNRRSVPVAELTIVPYTPSEWAKVMEEVKTLYYRKQYKQCSARCIKLLDSIRDPYHVHPLYSITLAFFAASSLESTAAPLHNDSPLKLPLFTESLTYYALASSYISFADMATKSATITQHGHKAKNSSISSSLRSSVDSIFSQASISTCGSSILDSPYSTDSEVEGKLARSPSILVLTPKPLRTKKRVSFHIAEPPTETSSESEAEPIISNENTDLLARFPSPPTHATLSPTIVPTTPNYTATAYASPPSSPSRNTPSLNRYRSHLSSLEKQLEYHTTSIKAQIHTVSLIRRARRSNLPDLFPGRARSGSDSSMTSNSSTSVRTPPQQISELQEVPQTELAARIQRIREDSWTRKRFNPQKYKDLCERAIFEMEEEGWRSY